MSEDLNEIVVSTIKSQEEAIGLVEKLFAVAKPSAVFGEPVSVGEHTIITASEVKVGMGYGIGGGGGTTSESVPEEASAEGEEEDSGYGFGSGGGGVSGGRPVAAIVVGPHGVRVDPIVDVTRLGIAFLTTIGAMFVALNRLRKVARELGG
jgi:uncharacterized spore protein YtfJ